MVAPASGAPGGTVAWESGVADIVSVGSPVAASPGPGVLMLLLDPYERDARVEKQVATLVAAGHPVTVLAWNRHATSRAEEERGGARIERVAVRSPSGSKWRALSRIARVYVWYVRRGRVLKWDVLVAHDMYTWIPGLILGALLGRRVVLDAHEPYAEQIVGILPSLAPLLGPLRWLEGFLARRGHTVLTVTPRMVTRLQSLGVRRVFYLPNVPNVIPSAPARGAGAAERLVIGSVGSITPRYSGVEHFLEVAELLRTRGVPVHAVLGGPVLAGWEPEFLRRVEAAGSLVQYLGVVPFARVPEVLETFDVMLSLKDSRAPTSEYGYSTKIFDAMAAGVPVVTTRVTEDPDLVESTGCGVVVAAPVDVAEVADRVVEIWRDPLRRQAMREAGLRAVAERYRWGAFEQAYRDVLFGPERPGRRSPAAGA